MPSKRHRPSRTKSAAKPPVNPAGLRVVAIAKPFYPNSQGARETYLVIAFKDHDAHERECIIPYNHFLTKKPQVIEALSSHGYHWDDPTKALSDITALAACKPERRMTIAFFPGWHDNSYVRPSRWYSPDGDQTEAMRFQPHPAVKLGHHATTGTLKEWREAAKLAAHSDVARCFVSLAFAAPILKLIDGVSFGMMIVGASSLGKSTVLRLAASVPGHIENGRIPTLGASLTALEQILLGYRDGFIPLDDTGELEGDDRTIAAMIRMLGFIIATGSSRNRANQYELSVGTIKPDNRVILGLSSEKTLRELARRGGRDRLRGEEVRLIEIPIPFAGTHDIFNGAKANKRIGSEVGEREAAIRRIETICNANQGVALDVFLKRLCKDRRAKRRLRKWISEFREAAQSLSAEASHGRIVQSFAVTYAAARLAIKYKIVPWGEKSTRKAILACARQAIDHLPSPQDESTWDQSDDAVLAEFRERMASVTIATLDSKGKAKKDAAVSAIKQADGYYDENGKVLLKASRMNAWYPGHTARSRVVRLLRRKGILQAGRRSDTGTIQMQHASVGKGRQGYYRLEWPHEALV
jgi:hypothetical protein